MSVSEARAADRACQWESAGALYDEAIAAGDRSLETLLDAAVLYWQSTDGGLPAARFFSREFWGRAGSRPRELLAEAASTYPSSTLARFWMRYIANIDFGERFGVEDARRLLEEDPGELVPVLRIVMTPGHDHELPNETSELFKRSHAAGTARGRYVASVLSNILAKNGEWATLTTKVPLPAGNTEDFDERRGWTSVRFAPTEFAPAFERALVSSSRPVWKGPWITLYFWAVDDPGPVEAGRKFELLRDNVVVGHGFVH
ncbi:MAG TPA: hypothetical protein VGM90_19195 [Kofleriaceae bacterium]|jgi:hypothetical protein